MHCARYTGQSTKWYRPFFKFYFRLLFFSMCFHYFSFCVSLFKTLFIQIWTKQQQKKIRINLGFDQVQFCCFSVNSMKHGVNFFWCTWKIQNDKANHFEVIFKDSLNSFLVPFLLQRHSQMFYAVHVPEFTW